MLGVLGGTFDPVHLGHLIIAEEARVRLGLKGVLFLPAGQPWMKSWASAPAPHRLEMLRLALASNPTFHLSTLEMERAGPSYTYQTLPRLQEEHPGEELSLLLGWDALEEFPRWKEPGRILELAQVVAFPRAGFPAPDLARLRNEVPALAQRLILMEGPVVQISSTEVRRRVKEGLSIRYLVPREVEEYILRQGLYR